MSDPKADIEKAAAEAGAKDAAKKTTPRTKAKPAQEPSELVSVTVTTKGHGQVHDGEDGTYDEGAEIEVTEEQAASLIASGWVR